MLKSIMTLLKQDKEAFKVPRRVQDLVPIKRIWPDGERDTTGMPTYGLSGKNVLGEAITPLQQLIWVRWVHPGRIWAHPGAALVVIN